METLSKLFSSGTLVKVMRLFFFNPEEPYDNEEITAKAKSRLSDVKYETKLLLDTGFLKPKVFYKTVLRKQGKKEVQKKKKVKGFMLNEKFKYLAPLRALVVNTDLMNRGDIVKRLSRVGRIKMIAVAGVFMQDAGQRVDLLIVGDKIKQASLLSAIKSMESVIGTEIRYVVLFPDEFEYRVSVRDRLVRDIFEYPHLIALNAFKSLDLKRLRVAGN